MRSLDLRRLIFLALCCDMGLFAKRLIAPLTNIVTDALHIPGGVGTSFSLMFLVAAVALVPVFGCATVMSGVQSALALAFGMVGGMGALSVVGYMVPGFVIDLLMWATERLPMDQRARMMLVNGAGALCAALTANVIVFRLQGVVLLLYACVSISSGTLCGLLGERLVRRLKPVLRAGWQKKEQTRRAEA